MQQPTTATTTRAMRTACIKPLRSTGRTPTARSSTSCRLRSCSISRSRFHSISTSNCTQRDCLHPLRSTKALGTRQIRPLCKVTAPRHAFLRREAISFRGRAARATPLRFPLMLRGPSASPAPARSPTTPLPAPPVRALLLPTTTRTGQACPAFRPTTAPTRSSLCSSSSSSSRASPHSRDPGRKRCAMLGTGRRPPWTKSQTCWARPFRQGAYKTALQARARGGRRAGTPLGTRAGACKEAWWTRITSRGPEPFLVISLASRDATRSLCLLDPTQASRAARATGGRRSQSCRALNRGLPPAPPAPVLQEGTLNQPRPGGACLCPRNRSSLTTRTLTAVAAAPTASTLGRTPPRWQLLRSGGAR
mmetsp:Transcript_25764/g.48874  ORF Transcript_25764/g.48874 Transcript_25764/m.48874 type:complete len:364 (-) Transcript_25764:2617-3708(-)